MSRGDLVSELGTQGQSYRTVAFFGGRKLVFNIYFSRTLSPNVVLEIWETDIRRILREKPLRMCFWDGE